MSTTTTKASAATIIGITIVPIKITETATATAIATTPRSSKRSSNHQRFLRIIVFATTAEVQLLEVAYPLFGLIPLYHNFWNGHNNITNLHIMIDNTSRRSQFWNFFLPRCYEKGSWMPCTIMICVNSSIDSKHIFEILHTIHRCTYLSLVDR